MVTSAAKTVAAYLNSLPQDRREVLSAVRKVVLKNLPAGYEEQMQYGMISYSVPFSRLAKTYNGQPLLYASLASQKSYFAIYLMGVYDAPSQRWFQLEYEKTGKKLDMGKACVRFKTLDDLPLDVIGRAIARCSVEEFIGRYLAVKPVNPKAAKTKAAKRPR